MGINYLTKMLLLGAVGMGSMMVGMTSCSNDEKENGNTGGGGGNTPVTTYKVAFDSQGGSKVDTAFIKNGEKVTKPTDPTKEGSTFIAWYSVKNVSDTLGKQFDFNSVITKDITLYAFWKDGGSPTPTPTPVPEKTYDVTFDAQNGSATTTTKVKEGATVTKPTDPTWENHTFIGWYSTQNVADTAGKQFDFNSAITKDITLYGFWNANFLPGSFSVSATKQVYFTRSNLYWNGSALKFEANQTDYQTSWNANHVSHFYWTKTLANSYAESYSDGTCTVSDKFFADGSDNDHKLTVEGTSGLYVLSKDEWKNLLGLLDATAPRANANSLYKNNVTVGGVGKCLIIAPDDYDYNTNQLKEIYTLAEVNNLGLVCLPPAGYRKFSNGGVVFESGGQSGFYCFSVPDSQDINQACRLYFSSSNMDVLTSYRNNGQSVRAVCAKN